MAKADTEGSSEALQRMGDMLAYPATICIKCVHAEWNSDMCDQRLFCCAPGARPPVVINLETGEYKWKNGYAREFCRDVNDGYCRHYVEKGKQ